MIEELDLARLKKLRHTFRWGKGDAITEDGIPFKCKAHNHRLELDNISIDGEKKLYCPYGDTFYWVSFGFPVERFI